jgi:hypothetical protein
MFSLNEDLEKSKQALRDFIAKNSHHVIPNENLQWLPVSYFETGNGDGTTIIYLPLYKYDPAEPTGADYDGNLTAPSFESRTFKYKPEDAKALSGMLKYNINRNKALIQEAIKAKLTRMGAL